MTKSFNCVFVFYQVRIIVVHSTSSIFIGLLNSDHLYCVLNLHMTCKVIVYTNNNLEKCLYSFMSQIHR